MLIINVFFIRGVKFLDNPILEITSIKNTFAISPSTMFSRTSAILFDQEFLNCANSNIVNCHQNIQCFSNKVFDIEVTYNDFDDFLLITEHWLSKNQLPIVYEMKEKNHSLLALAVQLWIMGKHLFLFKTDFQRNLMY